MKGNLTVSIDKDLLAEVKQEAKNLKISLSSYITLILIKRGEK